MTTFNSLILQGTPSSTLKQSEQSALRYYLYWRRPQLLVLQPDSSTLDRAQKQPDLPLINDSTWLSDCLKRSTIQRVRIDPSLGEAALRQWAQACEQSSKALYLRLPSAAGLPSRRMSSLWGCKRLLDWSAAAVLIVLLSPLFLAIALTIAFTSPGSVFFSQWRVGQRGKIFRILKFRTMTIDAEQQHSSIMANQAVGHLHKREDDPRITPLGKWLRRYSLDELPQLLNVLRGEMSLVGPRPWALYDAVRIPPERQERLNALPGITGAWQVESRSRQLDLNAVNDRDLEYLQTWSLQSDLKILLQTVPRILSGFGAF